MKTIFNKAVCASNPNRQISLLLIGFLIFLPVACQSQASMPVDLPTLTVSIVPQQFFVERLAGDYFQVNVMVQPGQSPENYEPTPAQMIAVSKSEAYILIGAPFEKVWVEKLKAANPDLMFFDSSKGIERIDMQGHQHTDDEHASVDVDGTGESDPHIWTSPELVKKQVEQITNLLVQLAPDHSLEITANLEIFLEDIDNLDQEIAERLNDLSSRKFMVYHPTWGYFARDYNLEQIAVEGGGTEPSAQELANIITTAKQENIHLIIVQPEFSQRSAQTVASQIGAKILPISSLDYDWFATLRLFANSLVESNSGQK